MFSKWNYIIPLILHIIIDVNSTENYHLRPICENDSCREDYVQIHSDLNGLEKNDPNLIRALKNDVLIQPNKGPQNLNNPSSKGLAGQYGQPHVVEDLLKKYKLTKVIKKRKQKGFFIEAGASCGEALSNSIYFEMKHDWTGLLAEPNPDFLKQLVSKNR